MTQYIRILLLLLVSIGLVTLFFAVGITALLFVLVLAPIVKLYLKFKGSRVECESGSKMKFSKDDVVDVDFEIVETSHDDRQSQPRIIGSNVASEDKPKNEN